MEKLTLLRVGVGILLGGLWIVPTATGQDKQDPGRTTRVSVDSAGTQANEGSFAPPP